MKKYSIAEKFRRGIYTFTGLAIRVIQAVSLLPLPFILACTGYWALYAHETPLSVMFRLGMASLGRVELFLLSLLYRASLSEVALFFGIVLTALAFGLITKRIAASSERASHTLSIVLAVWLGADLVIRVLPIGWNGNFGTGYEIFGFAVRLVCFGLVIFDLVFASKKRETKPAAEENASNDEA